MSIDPLLPAHRSVSARAGGFWADQTLLDFFDRNLAEQPDALPIVGHNTMTGRSERLCTAELGRRVRGIAAGLLCRGIAMPDPRLNERACAFAVLRPAATLTLADVGRYLLRTGARRTTCPSGWRSWPRRHADGQDSEIQIA